MPNLNRIFLIERLSHSPYNSDILQTDRQELWKTHCTLLTHIQLYNAHKKGNDLNNNEFLTDHRLVAFQYASELFF